jgi:TetR/AcrR family transcriptional regulator, regulator of autoinduction and epiphytic fitness
MKHLCCRDVEPFAYAGVVPRPAPRVDPRITRSRQAVLEAALDELAEHGYGGFTIDGVATRSGVARSTIYRLWPERTGLIADAIDTLNIQPRPAADNGDTPRQHVATLLRHLADAMTGSRVAACLPALIDGAERDPQLRALHHRYNDRRRAALTAAIAAAVEAGEVRRDVDPDLASTALAGAIVYRRVMTRRRFRTADVDALMTTVLGPPPSPPHPNVSGA